MSRGAAADADPVLALLADAGTDPRALYYLWEQQQWEAGKLDLATDAAQWGTLDPAARRLVSDSIAWRRLRAETATTALVPFVDIAPTEEQQVFLTTQLVDEARHLVFFDRVRAEVMGDAGERLEDRGGIVDDRHISALLTDLLPRVAADLRPRDAGLSGFVAGTVTYHLMILGAFGLTDHWALDGYLAELDVLPGIRRGLELEARAAHRHVAFGLGLVTMAIGREPQVIKVVTAAVERILPQVLSALASLAAVASAPYPGAALQGAASEALQRWCDRAGLELGVRS